MAIFRQASRKILCGASSISGAFREAAPSLSIVRHYADEHSLLKTPLYDFHVEQGGMCIAGFYIYDKSLRYSTSSFVDCFIEDNDRKLTVQ